MVGIIYKNHVFDAHFELVIQVTSDSVSVARVENHPYGSDQYLWPKIIQMLYNKVNYSVSLSMISLACQAGGFATFSVCVAFFGYEIPKRISSYQLSVPRIV